MYFLWGSWRDRSLSFWIVVHCIYLLLNFFAPSWQSRAIFLFVEIQYNKLKSKSQAIRIANSLHDLSLYFGFVSQKSPLRTLRPSFFFVVWNSQHLGNLYIISWIFSSTNSFKAFWIWSNCDTKLKRRLYIRRASCSSWRNRYCSWCKFIWQYCYVWSNSRNCSKICW